MGSPDDPGIDPGGMRSEALRGREEGKPLHLTVRLLLSRPLSSRGADDAPPPPGGGGGPPDIGSNTSPSSGYMMVDATDGGGP